ncbi:UNVERIFIED_CONTAM: gl [Trichonephila clavipes]
MLNKNLTEAFSTKSGLNKHLRTHIPTKNLIFVKLVARLFLIETFAYSYRKISNVFDVCNNVFSDNSAFKRHLRIHTKEKPHVCDICYRRFSHPRGLNAHLRTQNL